MATIHFDPETRLTREQYIAGLTRPPARQSAGGVGRAAGLP
jgi:hypothetical protein